MSTPTISAPSPGDAQEWLDFLIAEQAATYGDMVGENFVCSQTLYWADGASDLAARFAAPGSDRYAVAKEDGRIVGLASIVDGPQEWEVRLGYVPAPAGRELARLYVNSAYHGTGLADALMAAIDQGEDLYLWLIDGNERARRYYERRGFVALPERFNAGDSWSNVPMLRMVRLAPAPPQSPA